MLINEKALARELKAAYKSGYQVEESEGTIYIAANTWGVAMSKDILPRKILGLLAEHAGEIPDGNAMMVRKNAENQLLLHGEVKRLFDLEADGEIARQTPIIYENRWSLFQKEDSTLIGFDTELLELVFGSEFTKPSILAPVNTGRWQAMEQTVIICPMRRRENSQLDYLEKLNWSVSPTPEPEEEYSEEEPKPEEEYQLLWTEVPDKPPESPPNNE